MVGLGRSADEGKLEQSDAPFVQQDLPEMREKERLSQREKMLGLSSIVSVESPSTCSEDPGLPPSCGVDGTMMYASDEGIDFSVSSEADLELVEEAGKILNTNDYHPCGTGYPCAVCTPQEGLSPLAGLIDSQLLEQATETIEHAADILNANDTSQCGPSC